MIYFLMFLAFALGWFTWPFVVGGWKCIRAQYRHSRNKEPLPMAVVAKRLTACGGCLYEDKGVCDGCGCILAEKAVMGTENCPYDFWNKGVPEVCKKQK